MSFDCRYCRIHDDAATRLTPAVLTAKAHECGLAHAYDVEAVDVTRHRWHRHLVDVVVHMRYGDDILDPQFPDEAKRAVTAAVEALLIRA